MHLYQARVTVIAESAIAIGRTVLAETALGTHYHCKQLTFQFDDNTDFFNHNNLLFINKNLNQM
jgi:hypothetical protein